MNDDFIKIGQAVRLELDSKIIDMIERKLSMTKHLLGEVCSTQKVGRNQPCPCGSGKKFKTCCLRKTAELSAIAASCRLSTQMELKSEKD